ncbi:MAG: hypothetical protein J3K34DRAFT_427373 [Monoraphidium minutum]|nr:MAG: hypothetical protein J3K34DRAFT_427373 [Monoraphidium minutum]
MSIFHTLLYTITLSWLPCSAAICRIVLELSSSAGCPRDHSLCRKLELFSCSVAAGRALRTLPWGGRPPRLEAWISPARRSRARAGAAPPWARAA